MITDKQRHTPHTDFHFTCEQICFESDLHLFQSGVRYPIAGYSKVSESVIQLMKEFYKSSIFSGLVGQDVGEFMAEILHQTSLRDMLENHIGYEGDICRENRQIIVRGNKKILHPLWYFL